MAARVHDFLSSRWGDVFFVVLVLCNFAAWWVGQRFQHPNDTVSVIAMYREEPGYHPLIQSFSEPTLGETEILENYGQGIRFMPLPSLLPFGILVRLFGPYGYVIADLTIPTVFYFLMRWFALLLSGDLFVSRILAFLCTLRVHKILQFLIGFQFPMIWGVKIPRPFVAELFFAAALVLLFALIVDPSRRKRLRWLGLAVLVALVAQSQFYFLLPLISAIAIAALYALFDSWRKRSEILELIAIWGGCIAIGLALISPFIVQRFNETPDIRQRMGLIDMDIGSMPSIVALYGDNRENNTFLSLSLAAGALFIVWFLARRNPNAEIRRSYMRVTQMLGLLLVVSMLAPWIVALVLRQMLLMHHFERCLIAICSYCCIASVLMLMRVPSRISVCGSVRRGILALVSLTALLLFPVQLWHFFHVSPPVHTGVFDTRFAQYGDAYRVEFSKLTQFLRVRAAQGDKVLASFDTQVNAWWSSFGGGFVYAPDPTNTLASNEELEQRVLEVARLINMPETEFRKWVRDPYNIVYFLLLHKYVASRHYMASDRSNYYEEDLAKAWTSKTRLIDANVFAMPRSEESRLTQAMLEIESVRPRHHMDLLVIAKPMTGEPMGEQFEKVYSNDIFSVYQFLPDPLPARPASK